MTAAAAAEPEVLDDEGFTLVEMVVALFVVSLVAVAFAGVLVSTLDGTRWLDLKTAGNQVAQEHLESAVALPWAAVGLYAADPGYVAAGGDGGATVTLTGTRPAGAPVPSTTVTRRGTAYLLRTDVTWQDDPADGTAMADRNGDVRDKKHVVVTATWADGARSGRTTLDGLRAPSATEVPATSSAPFTVTMSAPSRHGLTSGNALSGPLTITATTSRAAVALELVYRTRSGGQTAAFSGSGTSWSVVLPSGTGVFDTGNSTFTATGTGPGTSGTASGSHVVQLLAGTPSSGFTASVAPGQTLKTDGTLNSALQVSVTGSQTITASTAAYTVPAGGRTLVLTGSGTGWTGLVPADATVFASGTLVVTITTSFSDGSTSSGTATVQLVSPIPPPQAGSAAVVDQYPDAPNPNQSFCVRNGNGQLFNSTTVRVTVAHVATTDAVRLTFPGYTLELSMSYTSTNPDGTHVFSYVVGQGTGFGSLTTLQLQAYAVKTIDGVQYRDDAMPATVSVQRTSNQGFCV